MNKGKKIILYFLFTGVGMILYGLSGLYTGVLIGSAGKLKGFRFSYFSEVDLYEYAPFYLDLGFYLFLGGFITAVGLWALRVSNRLLKNSSVHNESNINNSLKELKIYLQYNQLNKAKNLILSLKNKYPDNDDVHKEYLKVYKIIKQRQAPTVTNNNYLNRLVWNKCTRCKKSLNRFSLKTCYEWFDYRSRLDCKNCKLPYVSPYWVSSSICIVITAIGLTLLRYLEVNDFGHPPKIILCLSIIYAFTVFCPVRRVYKKN